MRGMCSFLFEVLAVAARSGFCQVLLVPYCRIRSTIALVPVYPPCQYYLSVRVLEDTFGTWRCRNATTTLPLTTRVCVVRHVDGVGSTRARQCSLCFYCPMFPNPACRSFFLVVVVAVFSSVLLPLRSLVPSPDGAVDGFVRGNDDIVKFMLSHGGLLFYSLP